MNKRLLILVLSALLLPVFAAAQSISEIEAAKAMAKSYGYSESEIEALLNDPSKAKTSTETTTLDSSPEPEGVIQLKRRRGKRSQPDLRPRLFLLQGTQHHPQHQRTRSRQLHLGARG